MDKPLAKIRHERSKQDFPDLKLDEDEYVEVALKRARVCLWMIFCGVSLAIIIILLAFLLTIIGQDLIDATGRNFLFIILFTLLAATLLIGIVALMIYNNNKFFVTNKHVIQVIMESPVLRSVNIIDLPSIEDASFHQHGILQSFLHYGTLRLATVGDETTYTFKYSDVSSEDLKIITRLITEAKKRGKKPHKTPTEDTAEDTTEESTE